MDRKDLEALTNEELMQKLSGLSDVDKLLPVMNRRVVIDRLLVLEMEQMTKFEVWSEGYHGLGTSVASPASSHGVWPGKDFGDACQNWVNSLPTTEQGFFDRDKLTYWGSHLFSTEAEARKSFG